MKKSQLIGIGIAGVAGLGAFVLMKAMISAPPPPPPQNQQKALNTTEVLVARSDIPLGEVVTEGHFRWQTWPKDAVTSSFISKDRGRKAERELAGRIARAPFLAGEPITEHKLIASGSGGVLAAILPAGMRAISTKIRDEEKAVGRLILPNDHVDVILIRRMRGKGGQESFLSDTLFTNVRVLAIGQQIETKEGKKSAEGTTATLELTPRQAELLALGNQMGDVTLSLRSVADLKNGGGPSEGSNINEERGNAIRILRYGSRSRAYGVN